MRASEVGELQGLFLFSPALTAVPGGVLIKA
jgi:hypothetical protein